MSKEINILPELRFPEFVNEGNWELKNVDEFFDVGSSKRVLQKDWTNEGIPFYRTRELVSLSKNEPFGSEIYISEMLYEELKAQYSVPTEGDFLVSGVGTLGISYQVKIGDKFYFKDGNVLWFKLEGDLISSYFKYCFESEHIQKQIVGQTSKSTVGTYTITNAKKTEFWYTENPKEQQKIASCLSSLDELLATHNDKLDALKDHKKGLMQNLFPNSLNHDSKGLKDDHDFDAGIKSRNKANQKNQGSDNVPKVRFAEFEDDGDWVEKTIGEFAPLQRGFDLPVDNIVIGDYPVVFSNGILKYHNEFKVNGPGVVTGRSGTIGKVTYVEKDFWPHNTSLWVTDFCGNFPMFVFYYFVSIGLQQFSAGGGVPTLNRNDVHRHNILVPPTIQEQQKISSCLSELDELITAQAEKIEQLQQHKKGLMQGLFPKIES